MKALIEKTKNINIDKILIGILLFSFCIPKVNLFFIGEQGIKVYRVIVAIYFIIIVLKYKTQIYIPSKKLLLCLMYMIITSIMKAFFYGVERLLFDYIFAFAVLFIVYNMGKNLDKDSWIDIIQKIAVISLIIVLLNILQNKEKIVSFLQNPINQHPIYKSIFTGGVNLEATWIALFAFFFTNKPKIGYAYIIACTFVSIVLTSRVGIIIDIIVFLYLTIFLLRKNIKERNKRKLLYFIILLLILIIIGTVILVKTNFANNVINRMKSIGSDGGSQGRIRMWKYIDETLKNNVFGYGAGNSIKAIENVSGLRYDEDNVHNLFFQMTLDFGFVGAFMYLYLVITFIKKELKNVLENPWVAFLLTYIIIGLIQFKGAEIITFFMIGVYLALKNKDENKSNKIEG